MFRSATPVKAYYYKNNGQEILIGNEEVYQQLHQDELKNKKIYTKMTKARRKIVNTYAYIIESMKKDVVNSHVEHILSKLKAKGYTFKKEHYYLSNAYCN
tara:strand:- start:9516 stop:9815 length:300 start_codon:yes stop_codon:yes gene_type:complete